MTQAFCIVHQEPATPSALPRRQLKRRYQHQPAHRIVTVLVVPDKLHLDREENLDQVTSSHIPSAATSSNAAWDDSALVFVACTYGNMSVGMDGRLAFSSSLTVTTCIRGNTPPFAGHV